MDSTRFDSIVEGATSFTSCSFTDSTGTDMQMVVGTEALLPPFLSSPDVHQPSASHYVWTHTRTETEP